MASALDALVPGRVRVVVGAGGSRSSYEALGCALPRPAERLERMRRTVSALKEARIQVDVAGTQDEVLEIAATDAAGWALSHSALDAFFERVHSLRAACASRGRSFDELRVGCTLFCAVGDDEAEADPAYAAGLVGSVDRAVQRLGDLSEHGLRELRVVVPNGSRGRRCLERLMRDVVPQRG